MTTARRLQIGSTFVVPATALKYGGALVRVTARSYQTWGGDPLVSVDFAGVDVPEINGCMAFAPQTELDDGPAAH